MSVMRKAIWSASVVILLVSGRGVSQAQKPLDIYFIDVEGGQATLAVSPSGESLLVDAGWPGFNGRDADRIAATARQAGVSRIDYLVVTHYHTENAQSVGTIMTFGRFRMIDLGDLTWNKEHDLVCPNNRLGTVDVYLTTHHGLDQSGAPVIVHALHPRVAVMNNGAKKGGTPAAWQAVRSSPGLEDLWQLHFAVDGGSDHNVAEPFIANMDETTSHGIRISASSDGSFTVTNGRNGHSKTYS